MLTLTLLGLFHDSSLHTHTPRYIGYLQTHNTQLTCWFLTREGNLSARKKTSNAGKESTINIYSTWAGDWTQDRIGERRVSVLPLHQPTFPTQAPRVVSSRSNPFEFSTSYMGHNITLVNVIWQPIIIHSFVDTWPIMALNRSIMYQDYDLQNIEAGIWLVNHFRAAFELTT
jgi:hypothetical protein